MSLRDEIERAIQTEESKLRLRGAKHKHHDGTTSEASKTFASTQSLVEYLADAIVREAAAFRHLESLGGGI